MYKDKNTKESKYNKNRFITIGSVLQETILPKCFLHLAVAKKILKWQSFFFYFFPVSRAHYTEGFICTKKKGGFEKMRGEKS